MRLCICNQGLDAFKPNMYGEEIVIERVIRKNGGSSYKLISNDGRLISTKRSDLNTIVEHFNLFVNNPCCILDQENAKLFLKGSCRDKYDLFLKATELKKMLENLHEERACRSE